MVLLRQSAADCSFARCDASWRHAGTAHVPADQLPAALKMAPRDWESAYRSPKPSMDDWLVMQSRADKRATWAAQVAQDQGWPRVLVHREAIPCPVHEICSTGSVILPVCSEESASIYRLTLRSEHECLRQSPLLFANHFDAGYV